MKNNRQALWAIRENCSDETCAKIRAENSGHRAWMEISLENLRHNLFVLRSVLPEGCAPMAVVKADAYGHGALCISRELSRLGVRSFCVASIDEGIELRKEGIKGEILILGYTHSAQFDLLSLYDLTQTVADHEHAMLMKEYKWPLRVHVKIDTGMHRIGEWWENADNIASIFGCENLRIDGVYTHLCTAESTSEKSRDFAQKQIKRFQNVLAELKRRGVKIPKTHVQSSYGVLNYPDLRHDYVRAGMALYGVVDESLLFGRGLAMEGGGGGGGNSSDFRPVLSIKARIALVRDIPVGDCAGYGFGFEAKRDTRIAILPIGYAEGIPRALSGKGAWAIIRGRKAPIIGRICMDSLMLDVTDIAGVSRSDVATLVGVPVETQTSDISRRAAGGAASRVNGDTSRRTVSGAASMSTSEKTGAGLVRALTAIQISRLCDTIPNEFLSRLGKRLERVYADE